MKMSSRENSRGGRGRGRSNFTVKQESRGSEPKDDLPMLKYVPGNASNYNTFKERFYAHALKEYGLIGALFETNSYDGKRVEEEEKKDDNDSDDNDEEEEEKRPSAAELKADPLLLEEWKDKIQEERRIKKFKINLYGEMIDHLSPGSKQVVEMHAKWDKDLRDPLKLWNIIT